MENMEYQSVEEQLDERVIEIARVSKTVKGGRRLRYRVTVVVGDNNGMIGMGSGKANAVRHIRIERLVRAGRTRGGALPRPVRGRARRPHRPGQHELEDRLSAQSPAL